MKRLGEYIVENNICDESSLDRALNEQSALKARGVFKPIGSVLAESGAISSQDLDKELDRMHLDILSSTSQFQESSLETIKETLALAEHKAFPEKTVIFREGDLPEAFFVVTSGEVNISVKSTDGNESVLAILKAADGFGEIALLTGEPHTTTATTIGVTSLLILSQKSFHTLCTLSPEVSMSFIKGFADRLIQKDVEIAAANEKERAYQQFVSEQDTLSLPELIGQTRAINKLRKKIDAAAQNDLPVLVDGEQGTEKLVVAGNIHKESGDSSAPFLSMDADNVALEGYGAIPEADSATQQLEMAQSSILFGYEEEGFSSFMTRRLGLLQICRQGTVVIQNIEKLTEGVQKKLHDYLLDGVFITVGGEESIASSARIIATSTADLDKLAGEERFDSNLLELLKSNSLTLPPIRKRKSDLRLLVDFIIIMECFKTPDRKLIKGFSPEAYQRIMEYEWPGNMDELQIVIRRAINLAQGDYLMPEDIFIGIAPIEGKYTINILQFDKIKAFFRSRLYPVGLQIMTALVFSLIFILAFIGSRSPDSNVVVLLVWAMWWPMLTISWFVGARIWCSVCPMGAVNDLLNRVGKKKFKVPAFIRKNGIYLSAIGLGVIVWAEAASKMPYSPMATGMLLLSIAFFAVLSGIIYERRLWCRYLCPLGQLAAIFSGCSVIEWRSNSSICNSTCTDNSCFKGDEANSGCPLYHGPFALNSNQNCILCGNCIKTCPNDSPALNLRVPGHELWSALKPEKVTTIFVPVILGTQLFRGIENTAFVHALEVNTHSTWLIYALLLILSTGISYAFVQAAGKLSFDQLKNETVRRAGLFTHAIIPLAFAFELVYQLKPLLTRLGSFFPVLGRQLAINLDFLNATASPGIVKFWQVTFLLGGMALSYVFLQILIRKNREGETRGFLVSSLKSLPIMFLGTVYIWMFMTG